MAERRVGIMAALSLALAAACSPTNHRVVLRELRHQLAAQAHECIPLGWTPVPVDASFYPGYTAQYQDERSWLAPLWLGSIRNSDLKSVQARTSAAILDALARVGMVQRIAVPGGSHYRLTVAAMPYFYARNDYGNNPDAIPYLCYSTIVPDHVVWSDSIQRNARRGVFHAVFTWHASPPAPWAGDAFLRAHSVVLVPFSQTVVATFEDDGGEWSIVRLAQPDKSRLPRLAVSAAWVH